MRRTDSNAIGGGEPERAVVEALHIEAAFLHEAVVGRAEQGEDVEGGLAALGPVPDMVAVETLGGGVAGEAASAVAVRECAAYRRRNAAGAPPDVQRLAVQSIDDGDDSGIAAQSPDGLRRDGGAVLDFAAPGASVRELSASTWTTIS